MVREGRNRNGWGVIAIDSMANEERDLKGELRKRKIAVQRQEEDNTIGKVKYNIVYKKIRSKNNIPEYLQQVNLCKVNKDENIRALIRIRCGNMEEDSKYWLGEEEESVFSVRMGRTLHYIESCTVTKNWFVTLGELWMIE